ncbi:hypothetical protein D3C72_2322130 [compost metagenome]
MATTMPATSAPQRASSVSADTIVCPVLTASSTTSTRRPRSAPARFGSTYNSLPASGVVSDRTGTDSVSSYQYLRE